MLWQANCHCESCRRACSAPFTTFFGLRATAWRWTGKAPGVYRSSPGVERFFCRDCGSPMGYRTDDLPDEMHGYAASLNHPERATPDREDFLEERLPWVHPGNLTPDSAAP